MFAGARMVWVTPALLHASPTLSGNNGKPGKAHPNSSNLAGKRSHNIVKWSSMRWYGQSTEGELDVQQQPWDTVSPRADASVLLAGRVQATESWRVSKLTERSSALENSISRSNHHEPRIRVSRGFHGPPSAHGATLLVRSGSSSRTRPSQCLAGPSPRRQLRITSVSARRAAGPMTAPSRSATVRLK